MIKEEQSNREAQRVSELISEYKKKGFTVETPTSPHELPGFLRHFGYVPDIIARSKAENYIVEVKSKQTQATLGLLSEIAEYVNAQPKWQFVLVLTNPRQTSVVQVEPNRQAPRVLLEKSRSLGIQDQTHVEAAFLFALAGLEAALRLLPDKRRSGKIPSTAWTLIRDATMEGLIARNDAKTLDTLFKARSSLIHGKGDVAISVEELRTILRLAEEILDLGSPDHSVHTG